ncbi:MAG: translocation protein TolB [endosymbiont of Galathealinum brachiosum]|uniref:Translocation protein TolB n=1 Tax=endosymbiont of Galathealinum brachiosum TaxID=2200906 RepID=A0A370DNL5_9GAMM|nr:MAG: translocation protein TolB [endosymbiont of Galathealinum brachiosum]
MNTRRSFLRSTLSSLAVLSIGSLLGCSNNRIIKPSSSTSLLDEVGVLLPPDENGLMLPDGFTSRVIANSGVAPYSGSPFVWHDAPDGGATFLTSDGGWIYVSNSEIGRNLGGVSSIRFDAAGNIINAYSILDNSNLNCAGGATPWGTWLSCEEINRGFIWECDPYGQMMPVKRPALGRFYHEAITVDLESNYLYMTEDLYDGCFYRFVPDSINSNGYPNLSAGTLEVAVVDSVQFKVNWIPVPDPEASTVATRHQVDSSTEFKGGEGIVYYNGTVSFATKGDNRIWSYNTKTETLSVVYDAGVNQNPILTGVDNITLSQDGELVVSEDGGDLQIVAITNSNKLVPLVQLVGHENSEITGPAFSPDGKRLYFSSQRGAKGVSNDGVTFEVTGPFHS